MEKLAEVRARLLEGEDKSRALKSLVSEVEEGDDAIQVSVFDSGTYIFTLTFHVG